MRFPLLTIRGSGAVKYRDHHASPAIEQATSIRKMHHHREVSHIGVPAGIGGV
jgi:hypothetical protein